MLPWIIPLTEYRADDLVKLEVLINKEPVDAFALIVHREDAYNKGQRLVTKLQIDPPPAF